MVRAWMRTMTTEELEMSKRLLAAALSVVLALSLLAMSCGSENGAEKDVEIPPVTVDVVDLVETLGEDRTEEDIVVLPQVLITPTLDVEAPCFCPAGSPGLCFVTSNKVTIQAEALVVPEEVKIDYVELSYLSTDGQFEEISTDEYPPTDGYYALTFDVEKNSYDLGDYTPAEVPDGAYSFLLTAESEKHEKTGEPLKAILPVTIHLDRSGPTIDIFQPTPEKNKVVEILEAKYCITDKSTVVAIGEDGEEITTTVNGVGVAPEGVRFFLGEEEIFPLPPEALPPEEGEEEVAPAELNLICPVGEPLRFDVGRHETMTTDFRIVATDCLGNESLPEDGVQEVIVIGLPMYEMPPELEVPDIMGELLKLQTANLNIYPVDEDPDDKIIPDALEPDGYADLLIIGTNGIATATNDGAGNFGAVKIEIPHVTVRDARVLDFNEDGAVDIVALFGDGQNSWISVYPQITKKESMNVEVVPGDPEAENPEDRVAKVIEDIQYYNPLGTYDDDPTDEKVIPAQTLMLSDADMHFMDFADFNEDGIADILLAGPNDELSAVMILHTGKRAPYGYETEADFPENFYLVQDQLQGVGNIHDMVIGRYREKLAGEPNTPDIVFVRGDEQVITLVTIDYDDDSGYGFEGGIDSIFCFSPSILLGKRPLWAAKPTDIYVDDKHPFVEDLVINTGSMLHFVPAKGNGEFDIKGYEYGHESNQMWVPKQICIVYYGGDEDVDDFESLFATRAISNTGTKHYLDDTFLDYGFVVATSGTADSVVLVDIVGPADSPTATDGVLDIVASVPSRNYIAIYRGHSAGQQDKDGDFSETLFVNPGPNPRSVVAADFDKDNAVDLACIVSDEERGPRIVLLKNSKTRLGEFPAPMEVPLPNSSIFGAGRVLPTHFAVADMDNDGDLDVVAATAPEEVNWGTGSDGTAWPQVQVEENEEKGSIPMLLAYEFHEGRPARFTQGIYATNIRPRRTFSDVHMGDEFSGMDVGYFNNDSWPDIVVTYKVSGTDACDGRTFDIFVGGDKVVGINDVEALGTGDNKLHFYYYEKAADAGYFRPMGGFLGLQNPTGVVAAPLDIAGQRDGLVMFGEDYSTPGEPDFQPDQVVAYLTSFDVDWNDCAKNEGDMQIYFECAPHYSLAYPMLDACSEDPGVGAPGDDDGDGEEEDPFICQPTIDPLCKNSPLEPGSKLAPGQAKPTDFTVQWEGGFVPVDGIVDHFDDDEECLDIMVLNQETHNVTYVRGICGAGNYKFEPDIQMIPVGDDPQAIQVSDLDHDGHLDAIAALADNISISYGNGSTFETNYLEGIAQGISPSSLVVQDVNADGWDDLLAPSSTQNRIMVYLNGGERDFLGPYILPCGIEPTKILVADMDEDGCGDVLVLNAGSGTFTVLRNTRCDEE